MLRKTMCVAIAATTGLASAFAGAEQRHHGAHVHGVAKLTIALEGNSLALAFTSPAMSIVGFEYMASSDAEREAVAEATAQLQDASSLFSFIGTQCELQQASVDTSAVLDDDTHSRHNHQDDHASGHDHEHDAAEPHTDISAEYAFTCADGTQLDGIKVGATDLPFGIETLEVMWVSDRGQGAASLSNNNSTIEFK